MQCSGSVDGIDLVIALGQCVPNTALPGFSPDGVTTVRETSTSLPSLPMNNLADDPFPSLIHTHSFRSRRAQGYYRFNAVSQTKPVIGGLQLTEYSDSKCTRAVATEIVFGAPWFGCFMGGYFGTYPASTTNPCSYLRQTGLTSSTTGNPPLPLVPGTWNVTSSYLTAAGCSDTTKNTAPIHCSASQYKDTTAKCPTFACQTLVGSPFGTEVGGTCLNVKPSPPTKAPTKKPTTKPTTKPTAKAAKPTAKPTAKGKVVAAVEAVGAALGLGLRGAAAAATEAAQA